MLRMSTLFLRTLREDPADAEVASHRLLVRAGYIRRAAPGGFTLAAARAGSCTATSSASSARRWTRAGFQEVHFPALLPREPYELSGPLDRLRRQPVPPQGPPRQRLPAGADARGDVHAAGEGPVLVATRTCRWCIYQIQTKYRDEARPRAGLLRGREFVMKDSYSFDLDDAGLRASATSATATPTSAHVRPARPAVRDRVGDVGGDGRLGQRGVPRPDRRRRGHVRALHRTATTPPTPRPCSVAVAAADRRSTTLPRRSRRTTRPTRRRSRRSSTSSTPAPICAAPTGAWTAADTLKNVVVKLRHPDGTHRAAGDRRARRPRGRPQAARGAGRPGRGRAVRRGRLRRQPARWSRATSGPARSAPTAPSGIRFLVDPRIVDGTRWVTGADAAGPARARPRRRARLHAPTA